MPPPDDEERGITQEQRGLPETPLLDISEEQYDKGFADFGRGIDSRLWNPNPGPEQVWVSSLGLAVGDCSKVPYLGIPYDPDADPAVPKLLTDAQVDAMHRAYRLSGFHFHNGTPCLVKLARALHRNLYKVVQYGENRYEVGSKASTKDYLELVQYLVKIYEQIKPRTEGPYTIWLESAERPALPKEILVQHPGLPKQ